MPDVLASDAVEVEPERPAAEKEALGMLVALPHIYAAHRNEPRTDVCNPFTFPLGHADRAGRVPGTCGTTTPDGAASHFGGCKTRP